MALRTNNLSVKIRDRTILQDINFEIKKGEVVGLLGPNGSGKSTLINTIAGITTDKEGTIEVSGRIGLCLSRKGFFEDLTVTQNLRMYGSLAGINNFDITNILKIFSIDYGNVMFRKLSAGMRQRVSLSLAFLTDYDMILLDEPTNHLDIDSILQLWRLVQNKKGLDSSFLIASPVTHDLEKICDRILFLNHGVIVYTETTQSLVDRFGSLEEAYLKTIQ